MRRYLLRRLAFALFLIVAVSSAALVLAELAPGVAVEDVRAKTEAAFRVAEPVGRMDV